MSERATGPAPGHTLDLAHTLSEYIKIPTENPPGREMPAILYLAGLLREMGLEPEIHETAPERGVLVCTVGPAHTPSVVLMHHVDVVPALSDGWDVPPFSGEIRDGYVWGRGALDMKGTGVAHLAAFLEMARDPGKLTKRVAFVAVSDEEQGGVYGAGWVREHLLDELKPEVIFNEGGFGVSGLFGPATIFAVEVAQKSMMKIRLTATGKPGHGSQPLKEYATRNLVLALAEVMKYRPPVEVNPVTGGFLSKVGSVMGGLKGSAVKMLGIPGVGKLVAQAVGSNPMIGPMLHDTMSLTMLSAGVAPNVIPANAEAMLDVRMLPGHDPDTIASTIRDLVKGYGVEVEALSRPHATSTSPTGTECFRTIERALVEEVPGAVVAPFMVFAVTDSRYFRDLGIPCYGIMPSVITQTEQTGVHGFNEKISIANLEMGARVMTKIVKELCYNRGH